MSYIYYKITNKKSEAYDRHLLFAHQHRQETKKFNGLCDELGLPGKYYSARGKVVGFLPPENEEDIPEGMHVDANDRLTPDRRTTAGKEIHKKLTAIQWPDAGDYMENLFGASARVIVESTRMIYGCTCKEVGDIVIIKVHGDVLDEARKNENFSEPPGLHEITGSEYRKLASQKEQIAKSA